MTFAAEVISHFFYFFALLVCVSKPVSPVNTVERTSEETWWNDVKEDMKVLAWTQMMDSFETNGEG